MSEELKYEHARFLVNKNGQLNNQHLLVIPTEAYTIINDETERKKYDGEPLFLCPGHDCAGNKCSAKLFVKKNISGTTFFYVNSQDDHIDGCGYRDYGAIRENKDGKKIGFTLQSFYNFQSHSNWKGKNAKAAERFKLFSDEIVLEALAEGKRVFNRHHPPFYVLELAIRLLMSKPNEVTDDNKIIEDQMLCKRTSDMFFMHLKNYPAGDCFLLAVQKSTPEIYKETFNEKKRFVLYMLSLYDNSPSAPVLEFVFRNKEERDTVLNLLKEKKIKEAIDAITYSNDKIPKAIDCLKKELSKKMDINANDKDDDLPEYKEQGYLVCAVYGGKFRKKFGKTIRQVYSFSVYSNKKFIPFPPSVRKIFDKEYMDCIPNKKKRDDENPSLF